MIRAEDSPAVAEGLLSQLDGRSNPADPAVGASQVAPRGEGIGVVSPRTRSQSAAVRS